MDVNRLVIEHLDLWTSATEKKSSAGRGNGGAVSLYGIAKLRKLILELAVSGKLVLQDNFTQERMDAAQEALRNATGLLVADGKARISGKIELDLVRSTDLATPNWYEASGQLIFPTRSGNSKLIKGKQHSEPASNLYPGFSASGQDVWLDQWDWSGEAVILSAVGARCGKAFPATGKWSAIANTHIAWILPDLVSLSFAMLLLNNEDFWVRSGGAQPFIKTKQTLEAPIRIPPLAEQHRIVDKVDELMGLCDALERQAEDSLKAHQTLVETCLATLTKSQSPVDLTQNWSRIEAHFDTLFATEESVGALRRAVLDLALRGLLTDQSEDSLPASDLLGKLYTKNKKSASSRHRTIVSKIKEVEPPFDLPESWAWSNLGLLSSDLRYGTSKKCDRDDKLVPVLRIPNVSGGRVDLDDMKFGPLDLKEVADLRLRTNDLLIIRSNGSLDIVGSFAVVPELEGDFAFAGYLVRVRIDPDYVDPQYIWYVSRSRFLRDQIEGPIRHGVGLKNVNSTELASLQFPIPPREEQERIVDKLDGLFKLCDQFTLRLRDQNTINLSLADTLTSKTH